MTLLFEYDYYVLRQFVFLKYTWNITRTISKVQEVNIAHEFSVFYRNTNYSLIHVKSFIVEFYKVMPVQVHRDIAGVRIDTSLLSRQRTGHTSAHVSLDFSCCPILKGIDDTNPNPINNQPYPSYIPLPPKHCRYKQSPHSLTNSSGWKSQLVQWRFIILRWRNRP